jgi:hypothetical protein
VIFPWRKQYSIHKIPTLFPKRYYLPVLPIISQSATLADFSPKPNLIAGLTAFLSNLFDKKKCQHSNLLNYIYLIKQDKQCSESTGMQIHVDIHH